MIRPNTSGPRNWTRRLLAVWLVLGVLLGGLNLAHAMMQSAQGDATVVSTVDVGHTKKADHGTPADHHCHGCAHFAQSSPIGTVVYIPTDRDRAPAPMVRLNGLDPGTPLRPPAETLLT